MVKKKKVAVVVGARPNFVKAAPVLRQLKGQKSFRAILIHTGQHYDEEMSRTFFSDLRIPSPDIELGVGSGTHAEQTGRIMIEFEKTCLKERPEIVVVVGDVNSTLACALVAAKLLIPVAHIEAGLRSYDRTMPEEINRILTDQISDYLFTTCKNANRNLLSEGIPRKKIYFVGNTMIDSLIEHVQLAQSSSILKKLCLRRDGSIINYAVLTLHRPSNVDEPSVLRNILSAVRELSNKIPVVFPVHPRTALRLGQFKVSLKSSPRNVLFCGPLGYLDFLCLMSNAKLVLTDSGGIQEETTILKIPCLTLRNNTERPITVTAGTNHIVGNNPAKIIRTAFEVLEKRHMSPRNPPLWDGRAAERIVKTLLKSFQVRV